MTSPETFLLHEATTQQLEQAAAHNHRELFRLNALSQGGSEQEAGDLTWTYSGGGNSAMVFFPSPTGSSSDSSTEHGKENEQGDINVGIQLDKMMAFYRAHPPKEIGCWSLDPTHPSDLGIKLLSRGFQPGWKPCWMALDLKKIKTGHNVPADLLVFSDNNIDLNSFRDLPYSGDNGAVSLALMKAHPDKAVRFIATLNGKVVGHSCVHFSTGNYGVAGIYNVGVIPSERNKGVGKAVVTAACLYAKEKGYHYAVLNATGRRMYGQIGFTWIGNGLTWWLLGKKFITDPPSVELVALAEAIGAGDLISLSQLSPTQLNQTELSHTQLNHTDLNKPMINGMTLMELAVYCRQPASAEWLIRHGAEYHALDAWDLDRKDGAAALLRGDPKEVDRQYGERQITLLHIAAEREDPALAKMVLSAGPDLGIRDKLYNSTALDWAQHLNKNEIIRLIKEYQTSLNR